MSQRVRDLADGLAMIVTDLHGDWDAYARYRDRFLRLHERGAVDHWILCGDLIHSEGPAHSDRSLEMILDVMGLQEAYGPDAVIMLTGNHEFPHLYGFTLSRGAIDYTPRFERALVQAGPEVRSRVMAFIDGLPFYARTAAGVMIAHCGAAPLAAMPENREQLLAFSHQALIQRLDELLAAIDLDELRDNYERLFGRDYDQAVRDYLAVTGPTDPRYRDLLRSLLLNGDSGFLLLWDTFFTLNERGMPDEVYANVLNRFLETWSVGAPAPQRVLVSGHIPVQGGHRIVAERQLRLASWAHAHPHESGVYLRLDCASPVQTPDELVPHLGSVYAA